MTSTDYDTQMMMVQPRLFISHASEDKEAVVAALAENLSRDHEVWYDEYALKVGHSLREQIDNGLRQCDFGVVVLSPSYFGKHWTNNELDGLFALESSNRKIIIPVWWCVGKAEVLHYSPMLAGRVGSRGKSADSIADEIRGAIAAALRAVEIERESRGKIALLGLVADINQREDEARLFNTAEGANRVNSSFLKMLSSAQSTFGAAIAGAPGRFDLDAKPNALHAYAGYRFAMTVLMRRLYTVHATDAHVVAFFYRHNEWAREQVSSEIETMKFTPKAIKGVIRWTTNGNDLLEESDVSSRILERFAQLAAADIKSPPMFD